MIIPLASDCSAIVSPASNAQSDYVALFMKNLGTALDAGDPSCTLTTSGKAAEDIIFIITTLRQRGYTVTQASTTLTIRWRQ